MPEPLIHFIIPFFLLIMFGLSIKKAALISSLAVLPDLDVLFHVHRSMSHSAFFILLFSFPLIIITRKFYSKGLSDMIIATLVVLSHPFMDLFTGYTPIFWPIFNKSIYVVSELRTNMNNVLDLNLKMNVYFESVTFRQTTDVDAHIFSSIGVAISLVLLTGLVLKNYSIRPPKPRP
jgi:hypothetical protein